MSKGLVNKVSSLFKDIKDKKKKKKKTKIVIKKNKRRSIRLKKNN